MQFIIRNVRKYSAMEKMLTFPTENAFIFQFISLKSDAKLFQVLPPIRTYKQQRTHSQHNCQKSCVHTIGYDLHDRQKVYLFSDKFHRIKLRYSPKSKSQTIYRTIKKICHCNNSEIKIKICNFESVEGRNGEIVCQTANMI